jgi:pyridinium-3,5-biscarboxylic acid mononucleotide sulfurtransferase
VGVADFALLVQVRAEAVRALKEAGFQYVALDLEPFRSGRLNEAAGLVKLGAR